MADDSVNYSSNENRKYRDIVESINTDKNLFIRKILYYFKFDKLLNNQGAQDDTKFKYLLGYIPNENIEYGNSEFIKFLTTPILLLAIFILIAVPQIDDNTPKVGLFWLVIIGLYTCYTAKHMLFISKLWMQFNTFLENNLYKNIFNKFLENSSSNSFFYVFVEDNSVWGYLRLVLYLILKAVQSAIIPGILIAIIFLINSSNLGDYKLICSIILVITFLFKFGGSLYTLYNCKNEIYNHIKDGEYNEKYDTYYKSVYKWMIVPHKLFSGGDSAFCSYLFTKTFTLIFGILMFIIGIPIYSIVLSITLLYVSLNFIYNIIIFPLTKPKTREKIFEIIKENGSLLALLFTGLTINSIYQSHIFGDRNKQIIGIMCAVYAILVLMHLGRKNFKKNNTE